jgi:hypothetical protein
LYKASLKGIGSDIILQKIGWKKFAEKKKNNQQNNQNHLKSNNYDICTAAALCNLNILDVMVFENIFYLQILNMNGREKYLRTAYAL